MVTNILISGVATSCDKNDKSPYYVINFSKSDDSTIITSGKDLENETVFIYEKYKSKLPKKFFVIKKLIDELIRILNERCLDIEFAIDQSNKLYLLQVRKLVVHNKEIFKFKNFDKHLEKLKKKISKVKKRNYQLLGKTTYFGVMPDWNPAEIIGRRPSPLALSLYKELITDNIWAMQRRNYGFKNLENHQLLNSFYGMPYIDIRIDFNSWIPCDLDKKLSEKLVNFYLKKFKKNPQFHDKIEFEIVLTCFSFTLKQRINKLPNNIFSKIEKVKIFNSLKKINLKAYSELKEAPKKINLLKKKIKILVHQIYIQ